MLQSIACFEDVQVHASAIGAWNQTYAQISAGRLESSLSQLASPRCHVFRERINQRVVQHGEAPRGRVCFALPIAVPGAAHMQGRKAHDKDLFFLRGGEEFMFHMPMGMDMLAITFDQPLFEECLANLPQADGIRRLLRQPVIKVPPRRFAACREQLMNLFSWAVTTAALEPDRDSRFEVSMLQTLLALMADPACDTQQRSAGSTHSYIVDKLHRLAVDDAVHAPSILEACQLLHVSRRTVQNSFRRVAETTPVQYLRSVRLNGVRRDLIATAASELSIGDAAARWGFFHLSHFAEEFQALFGELPSQTPRGGLPHLQ